MRNGCAATSLDGILPNGHILLKALLDSDSLIAFTAGGFGLILPQLIELGLLLYVVAGAIVIVTRLI